MLKHYFIPSHENDFVPHVLSKRSAIFSSVAFLLIKFLLILSVVLLPLEAYTQTDELRAQTSALYALTNQFRAQQDLPALTIHPLLEQSAQNKARASITNQTLSHGQDTLAADQIMRESGYAPRFSGENLAMGLVTGQRILDAWKHDPAQRAELLRTDVQEMGLAFEKTTINGQPTIFVVQHLASATLSGDEPVKTQRTTIDSEHSFVSWKPGNDGGIQLDARAIIQEPVASAQMHVGSYEIPLTQDSDVGTIYQGSLLIQEEPDAFFAIVISPSVEALTTDGQQITAQANWETFPAPTINLTEKYLASKYLENASIHRLLEASRTLYGFFFALFLFTLCLSIAVHKQHGRRTQAVARTGAVLFLLCLLILI